MHRSSRHFGWPLTLVHAALAGVLVCAAAPAMAFPGCDGTMAATLFHDLPTPLVVALDVHDPSPRTLALVERFKSGLRSAKVATEGTPTAQLHVNADVIWQGSRGKGETRIPADSLDWAGGGPSMQVPDMARRTRIDHAGPNTLSMRVDLTLPNKPGYLWIASLTCTLTDGDEQARAESFGLLIGGVLGQTVRGRQF